ncbi:MAG: redox-sensing transcriptional repressor Rex [Oscillospiraceae bacterium]|nr:redox-sensing transcriptional repressor Rex [Oscillospiraceae bacterium]
MSHLKASLPVIRRLPRYYRYITDLKNNGVSRISSSQLANIMGSTPSQVRQDFNCFGGFGQQGVGYSVELLHSEIERLLFPENKLRAVLLGAGNMGITIANFVIKENTGVELIAVFDNDKAIIGNKLFGLEILSIDNFVEYCQKEHIDVIIACTSKESAEELAPQVIKSGVKGIWNYSHFDFSVYDDNLIVENVHLRDSLMSLSYRITHKDDEPQE